MVRVTLMSAALTLFARDAVAAQEAAPPAVHQMRPGQTIRIITRTGEAFEAKFRRPHFPPHGMILEGRIDPFPFDAIDSLWARHDGVGPGAGLGALFLGLPSGLMGVLNCTSGNECAEHMPNTLLGVGLGVMVGSALGSGAVRWDLLYTGGPGVEGDGEAGTDDGGSSRMALWRGSRVRIAAAGAPRVSGEVLSLRNQDLVLSRNGVEQRITVTPMDTLWGRRGLGPATRIGMVAGVAIATTWLMKERSECSSDACSNPGFPVVAIGAGGGALVGMLAGLVTPRWRRIRP
jgi:hypothetical protein